MEHICLPPTWSTVHKSIIDMFWPFSPALPFYKCVCKSQKEIVFKSQNICPYVCVSHKIANVCVSYKKSIDQVLPRGADRGGRQWSAMVSGGLHVKKLLPNLVKKS